MRKSMFATGVAAIVATALSLPSALQAHDTASPRGEGGSKMGPGMMNQMGGMMDHCNQMMGGSSSRPNEQWRDGTPPANGKTGKER